MPCDLPETGLDGPPRKMDLAGALLGGEFVPAGRAARFNHKSICILIGVCTPVARLKPVTLGTVRISDQ